MRTEKKMTCYECRQRALCRKLSSGELTTLVEMIKMRKTRDYRRAVCSQCLRQRSVQVKQQIKGAGEIHRCKSCGQEREAREFDHKTLENLIINNKVYDAVCLHCDASQLDRFHKETYLYICCKKNLPASSFSIARKRNHNTKTLKCEDCERPPCSICGARPEKPLTNQNEVVTSLTERKQYKCVRCKYPPCARCGMTDFCLWSEECPCAAPTILTGLNGFQGLQMGD